MSPGELIVHDEGEREREQEIREGEDKEKMSAGKLGGENTGTTSLTLLSCLPLSLSLSRYLLPLSHAQASLSSLTQTHRAHLHT